MAERLGNPPLSLRHTGGLAGSEEELWATRSSCESYLLILPLAENAPDHSPSSAISLS